MCTWNCKKIRRDCLFPFKNDKLLLNGTRKSMSIEEFYKRTRLCENYHRTRECSNLAKTDWPSFVDFAELLWYPKSYLYKTAFNMFDMMQKVENDRLFPDEVGGFVEEDVINEGIEKIKERIMEKYESKTGEPLGLLKYYARRLCSAAWKIGWRDEKERTTIEDIVNNESYLDYIDEKERKIIENDIYNKKVSDKNSNKLFLGLEVHLEYTLDNNPKSVDILLEDKTNDRYACVELKQWTESGLLKEENSLYGYQVKRSGGTLKEDRVHPLVQAGFYALQFHCGGKNNREQNAVWKEFLQSGGNEEELNPTWDSIKGCEEKFVYKYLDRLREEGQVLQSIPLVYLHNQFYEQGMLYSADRDQDGRTIKPLSISSFYNDYKNSILNYDFIGARTMITRHRCELVIETLDEFFKGNYKYK